MFTLDAPDFWSAPHVRFRRLPITQAGIPAIGAPHGSGRAAFLFFVEFLEHGLDGTERVLQLRVAALTGALCRRRLVVTARPVEQRQQLAFRSGQAVFLDILGFGSRRRQEVGKVGMCQRAARAGKFRLGFGADLFGSPRKSVAAVLLPFLRIGEAQDGL